MKPFRSRSLAMEVAAILRRMTGDRAAVITHYTDKNHAYWRVVRTDPSGNEHEV